MKKIIWLLMLISSTVLVYGQNPCDNRCLSFDGTDDYVQLTKSPLQGNINFTLEASFLSLDNDGLTTCPSGNFERIIGCGGSRLEVGECSGKFAVFIAGTFLSSGVTTNDGLWHHFAVTKNNNNCEVFLDCNSVLKFTIPATPAFSLDNTFRIGRWPGGGGLTESWQGNIDEVRVWSSTRTQQQICAASTCSIVGNETGLVAYYNFNQGNPSQNNTTNQGILIDLTAAHNNGTLTLFALNGAASNWICSGSPAGISCSDTTQVAPVLLTPTNNGNYKVSGPLPNFSWKWNGTLPAPPVYYLEVFSVNGDLTKSVFSKTVDINSVSPSTIFGANPPAGLYQWQVTNPKTGQQSQPAYFTLWSDASCGTVSSTLKLVCKDWLTNGLPTYTATLTLTNTPTSGTAGCSVTYNAILPFGGGTFTGISPILPVVILPNATATFTFIFTPANLTQTSVTAQCFGVWQDALGNTAHLQNNVRIVPCFCKDCKEVNLNAINLAVTPVPLQPGKFNLSGNLTFAPQVSAIEFQVQSVTTSAIPITCSNGVTNVETSGMILNPSTTINGSSALVWFNETISPPIPPTNNNAAKDVKWIGGPISGPVPFNLTLGLPSPLAGLGVDCCKMKYRVCIKATIFYGVDQCRACSYVFCLDFTN